MALETVLRGTGDIGAMVSVAYGVRMIDRNKTLVHVENIKSRDFVSPPAFQIRGDPHTRPYSLVQELIAKSLSQLVSGDGLHYGLNPGRSTHLAM